IQRGRDMLEKELGKNGFESLLKSEQMLQVAQRCNYHSVEDLLVAVGYGELTLNQVVHRLRGEVTDRQTLAQTQPLLLPGVTVRASLPPASTKGKHPIAGVEGLVYHLARCCTPIPGEAIIGIVTRGDRGISIHRQGCSNVDGIPGDRLVPVNWNPTDCSEGRRPSYPVEISIEVLDRVGVLNDILSRLKDNNVNVRSANVKTYMGKPATIELGIDICDRYQLERTFNQIRQISDVLNLRRLSNAAD
ncbi:MAG TPA: ACT domain-containing protein, partial [Vampirovibrionales bacterium]